MSLLGTRYSGGKPANTIAIGFKFSTGTQSPQTYDAKPLHINALDAMHR